jgi:hypothetical protein
MEILIPNQVDNVTKLRNSWKPNPKQAEFLAVPWTVKEAFYGGGAGSGKSDVLLVYGILNRWHENPLFKQVFLRRTFPELKNEILGRSREIYSKFGATFNKTDMIWTFPREDQYGSGGMTGNAGAQIFLGHCETEDDVHKYDSMQISLFTPDEITSLTKFIYLYITFERNRSPKDSGLPSITRAAGMPGGIGHTFVKKRFVDPCPEGGKIIVGKGNNKRIYIHATLADNPHIDPTYSQSLDGRPEAERKAKKFGDWSAYLGQVFDEFRERHYPDEPEHALHIVTPFEIPEYWPKFYIIDWGFRANNWVGCFAVSPSRRLYLYRELKWVETKIAEWGPIVKELLNKEHPKKVKVCKSAGQERGQDHTIQTEIERELGTSVELTLNSPGSRVSGKMLFHEYLRWIPKRLPPIHERISYSEETALRIYRLNGEQAYRDYQQSFVPPAPETNLPKYQIFLCERINHDECDNCCPMAVESIKACTYADSKNDKPAEDVAEFNGDDAYDGQRYGIDAAEIYFDESADEFKKMQQQNEMSERLAYTGNWTAFYRNAESQDSVNKLSTVGMFNRGNSNGNNKLGIRMYHR